MNISNLKLLWRNKITILLIVALTTLLINHFLKTRANNLTTNNHNIAEIRWITDSSVNLLINKNKTQNFEVMLKNSGKNPLFINHITATCGCTSIKVSKEKILPGESAFLKGVIDSKGKSGVNISVVNFKANTNQRKHSIIVKYSIK